MSLSEAQTRKEIIDLRLSMAGWNVNDPSQVSEELDIIDDLIKAEDPKEKYSGHLFSDCSDYALLGKDGYPLAVVEAKKSYRNAEEGKIQSLIYAETIHKNNPGRDMPFVLYTNGHDIFFWNSQVYPPRKVYGFPTRDDLERLRFIRNNGGSLTVSTPNKLDKNFVFNNCTGFKLAVLSRGCSLRSPSLSFSPANTKQRPCCAWSFLLSRHPFKSKLLTGSGKAKTPFRGCLFCA